MSEEFESINDRMPDFESMIKQRILSNQPSSTLSDNNKKFDPYQVMLKKKEEENNPKPVDPSSIQKWPDKEVKALEEYCQKMGIIGFSSGRMPPAAALRMLKNKFGDDYTDIPLEERVPYGYQKIGTKINNIKKEILLG